MQFKSEAKISSENFFGIADFFSSTKHSKQFDVRGDVSGLYFGGTQFETPLGHRITWL